MSAPDAIPPLESEALRQRVRLYLYGELDLVERLELERLRDSDAAFRALFDDEQAFLLGLGRADIDAEVDEMLPALRRTLAATLVTEEPPVGSTLRRLPQPLRSLLTALQARPLAWQPAAAALLVVAGFLMGRGLPPGGAPRADWSPSGPPAVLSAMDGGSTLAGIEAVRLDPEVGQVQIELEERRVVTGASSDPLIRSLLMDNLHWSHAGARLASLEVLGSHASDADVRRMLLRSMLEDENAGVRLKALDTVRGLTDQPDVRRALVSTLLHDPSEGMRVHAIELLGERPGRDLAGALQELVEMERNPFVLEQTERILDDLSASMEHF